MNKNVFRAFDLKNAIAHDNTRLTLFRGRDKRPNVVIIIARTDKRRTGRVC